MLEALIIRKDEGYTLELLLGENTTWHIEEAFASFNEAKEYAEYNGFTVRGDD